MKKKVTVVLPTLNEESRVGYVMEQVAKSPYTARIIVVDGFSTDKTRKVAQSSGEALKEKYGIAYDVILSEFRHCGKGMAMISGMKRSLEYKDAICFFDSDIVSITPDWIEKLLVPIEVEGVDMCRGFFDRAPDDALITKHITRPLIALYFPELTYIRQPLGGELIICPTLAEKLIRQPMIAPTHTWGIDTWLLLNSSLLKAKIRDVYLGEKIHKPKEIVDLKRMAKECFRELVEIAGAFDRIRYFQSQFLLQALPQKETKVQKEKVVRNLENSIEQAVLQPWEKGLENILRELPFGVLLLEIVKNDVEGFKEKVKQIDAEKWIRILNRLVRLYLTKTSLATRDRILEVTYRLWVAYASMYMLYHTKTFEDSEAYVDEQCKRAFEMRKEILSR